MDPIHFITGSVMDAAMRIHAALGAGLFESVYEVGLERDLVEQTDLRLTDCRAGLWINFNEALLKNGIKRIVNRLDEPHIESRTTTAFIICGSRSAASRTSE